MSVHDVARALPQPAVLRDRCRAMAILDAALEPDPDYRRHRFDAHWRPGAGQELASMDHASGDSYSIVFGPAGVFILGFDHESPLNLYDEDAHWPGLFVGVPACFAGLAQQPAFSIDGWVAATVCLWREDGDDRWRSGPVSLPEGVDDGADWLFGLLLDGSPAGYQDWAADYYGSRYRGSGSHYPDDLAAVTAVFGLRPLTGALVAALNPKRELTGLAEDGARIGYPLAEARLR